MTNFKMSHKVKLKLHAKHLLASQIARSEVQKGTGH